MNNLMIIYLGNKSKLRRHHLRLQLDLRWVQHRCDPGAGQHHPSHGFRGRVHLRVHREGDGHVVPGPRFIGLGTRPIVSIDPNIKPLPVHILLLPARLQVPQFQWILETGAQQPAQENPHHSIAQES